MRLLKRETKFILLTEENLGTDNCDQEEYYGQTLFHFRHLNYGGVIEGHCSDFFIQSLKIRLKSSPGLLISSLQKDHSRRIYTRMKIAEEISIQAKVKEIRVKFVIRGKEYAGNPYLSDLIQSFKENVIILHESKFEFQGKTYPKTQLLEVFD